VIQLDGIWVPLPNKASGGADRRDRARHERRGKKDGDLVALGFWTENGKEKP